MNIVLITVFVIIVLMNILGIVLIIKNITQNNNPVNPPVNPPIKPVKPDCLKDEDCSSGLKCVNDKCVQKPKDQCRVVSDCPENNECVNGVCIQKSKDQCKTFRDCPDKNDCVNGICVFRCKSDLDCSPPKYCIDGSCKDLPRSQGYMWNGKYINDVKIANPSLCEKLCYGFPQIAQCTHWTYYTDDENVGYCRMYNDPTLCAIQNPKSISDIDAMKNICKGF